MEVIERVEILENNQLIVVLASGGNPRYQHIYREGAEVYWDNGLKAFTSPPPRSWSHSDWLHQIINVTKNCNINLSFNDETLWVNIPNNVKEQMVVGINT
ncbi:MULTISPECIES: hypothetical protein [Shewanella]|uniref:Integron Cassette Protein Hfx-Cass5 domain-containing protein n=1 Tax=Shewanella japonica TaxID=93973 RepID=A0ABM6JGQ8_9GAMM|nr:MULTISPECIES: hypothetical protein [Shewanella]ARD21392.1 hypothetical protein SJ2017_1061 [Shewanella japonica]